MLDEAKGRWSFDANMRCKYDEDTVIIVIIAVLMIVILVVMMTKIGMINAI